MTTNNEELFEKKHQLELWQEDLEKREAALVQLREEFKADYNTSIKQLQDLEAELSFKYNDLVQREEKQIV